MPNFKVFGTNVMVTVARSFDAPIKRKLDSDLKWVLASDSKVSILFFQTIQVIFPQDLIENGFFAEKHAMLGLGDIVIPGIFIAILLRFDMRYLQN